MTSSIHSANTERCSFLGPVLGTERRRANQRTSGSCAGGPPASVGEAAWKEAHHRFEMDTGTSHVLRDSPGGDLGAGAGMTSRNVTPLCSPGSQTGRSLTHSLTHCLGVTAPGCPGCRELRMQQVFWLSHTGHTSRGSWFRGGEKVTSQGCT